MGCASSAALPFLTNRGNAVAESPRMNGKPPYELKMVNNQLKNGVETAKNVNEEFVSEKMKEVVDSTAVQGVIGGVVQTKDEIVNQAKGLKDAVSETASTVVAGVEDTIESAFGKLTNSVGSLEDKLKSEVASVGENLKSALGPGEEKASEMKAEDIDELLESLPTEEEVTEAMQTTAEEVLEKAVEEMKQEEESN